MAITYHVNGAALITHSSNVGGTSMLSQGYSSEDGVHLQFNFQWLPILTDVSPMVPLEKQYMLESVRISYSLVLYDITAFNTMLGQTVLLGGNTPGTLGQAGSLLVGNQLYYRVIIQSNPVPTGGGTGGITPPEPCYNFLCCNPVNIAGRHGTKYKIYDCVWDAIPFMTNYSGGNTNGVQIWNNLCL